MRLLSGNLGRAIIKTSAAAEDRWTIEAPARIFDDQNQVIAAFKAGELDRDVVVVRFQGPRAHGMPELHKLTPPRSEEHTSELQSLLRTSYAVFCLIKNKKKNST